MKKQLDVWFYSLIDENRRNFVHGISSFILACQFRNVTLSSERYIWSPNWTFPQPQILDYFVEAGKRVFNQCAISFFIHIPRRWKQHFKYELYHFDWPFCSAIIPNIGGNLRKGWKGGLWFSKLRRIRTNHQDWGLSKLLHSLRFLRFWHILNTEHYKNVSLISSRARDKIHYQSTWYLSIFHCKIQIWKGNYRTTASTKAPITKFQRIPKKLPYFNGY